MKLIDKLFKTYCEQFHVEPTEQNKQHFIAGITLVEFEAERLSKYSGLAGELYRRVIINECKDFMVPITRKEWAKHNQN